ncbi:MAG: hypothetical protein HYS23_10025 [Geobacter sp.]|nr:hypothetical protein [Geobacter sp.]
MRKWLKCSCAAAACLVLSACTALLDLEGKLNKTSREYNEMVRWQELESACQSHVDKELREECLKRADAARDVKVADYRVVRVERSPSGKEATILVQIEYYIPPSATLKTLDDLQKWRYKNGESGEGWRLVSLPPLFQ